MTSQIVRKGLYRPIITDPGGRIHTRVKEIGAVTGMKIKLIDQLVYELGSRELERLIAEKGYEIIYREIVNARKRQS
jgi:hypothetical protein